MYSKEPNNPTNVTRCTADVKFLTMWITWPLILEESYRPNTDHRKMEIDLYTWYSLQKMMVKYKFNELEKEQLFVYLYAMSKKNT